MATQVAYGFSWNTVAAIVIAAVAHYSVRYLLRKRHPTQYAALRKESVTMSQLDSWRSNRPLYEFDPNEHFNTLFFKWMLKHEFLRIKDLPFVMLCIFSNVSNVAAMYFVFAEPIYYESVSSW